MALFDTLNDLKHAIREETERLNNAKFDAALGRIIASAEQRMYYGAGDPLRSEPLRLRVMESSAPIALTAGTGTIPTDYISMLRLDWAGSPATYPTYEAPHSFFVNRYTDTSGSPVRYTIEGRTISVSPKVTGNITAKYYARPTVLDDDTDTNTVLTTYPMLYFHAALIEAYSYLRNPNEMQKQFGAYVSLASGLGRSEAQARRGSSSPMAPRIPGARI